MKVKFRIVAIVLVLIVGLGIGTPTPTSGETTSQSSSQEALTEAKRLNQQTIKLYNQAKYDEAIPLAEKVLAIRKKVLGEIHPDTAKSLNNLAELYRKQGRYTEAETLYIEALVISGENHPNTAAFYNNLAELYREQGLYTKAEPLYIKALAILGKNHLNTATSRNNLAELYREQGLYTKSEPLHIKALATRKERLGENHPDTAESFNNLAELYRDQGLYTKSEPLYIKALAILGENHPNTAACHNNLALLYKKQGRYPEAERLYIKTLAIVINRSGKNHPDTAQSLNNLASLYQHQERYSEAEPLYKQSLAIRKERLGENHPKTAQSLNNLASLYQHQERYSEAEPLYKQSLAIRKERLGENHPDTAQSLNNLASLYQFQERYSEAELLYKQSLAIRKERLGENHSSTATSINNLASLYQFQGDIPHAIEYLSKGIEIEEVNLSQNLTAGDDKQKLDYIATFLGTTDGIISFNLKFDRDNLQVSRLALQTILQRKGRILDLLTNSLQILHQRTNDPKIKKLLDEFIQKQTQLANLTFKKAEDIKLPDTYHRQLQELQSETQQLADKLSRLSAEFGNISQPINLENIRKLIPANAALVEIVRYQPFNSKVKKGIEKFDNPHYAAYILYPNGTIKAKDLGAAKQIDDNLAYFRNNLRYKPPSNLQDRQISLTELTASARKLDAKLMQPIRQLLGNTRTILLSPDSALNLIPFETLVDEKGRYLVENYRITYLTSGRDLLRLKDKLPSQQPPLVIANPLYSQKGEIVAVDSTRSIDLSQQNFPRLEGTKYEAEALHKILPTARILTDAKATENAIKQIKSPSILHIATHGFFLEAAQSKSINNPLLRSGLVFAGAKVSQSGGDDGFLTALETTTLNLVGTKLVVLSACETGVGDITTGEGVYGLRRALVIAGSQSQLMSLWKVSDAATKDLMVAYYKRLKQGEGRSEALRKTQLAMLKGEKYQHPFYWASFIPSGDWTPMDFSAIK